RSFDKDFLLALKEHFDREGPKVIARVARDQPAAYLKICALLVPREMKLEHSGGIKAMTTEQIERGIELIKEILAKRDAAANARVREGEAEVVPSLPAPDVFADRSVKAAADKGAKDCKPRKRG